MGLPGPVPLPRYQSLDGGGVRGRYVHRQEVIGVIGSAWNPRHHLALDRLSLAPPSCSPASLS